LETFLAAVRKPLLLDITRVDALTSLALPSHAMCRSGCLQQEIRPAS